MSADRRYERLRPDELASLQAAAPVAYVPIGPMEFHGPHLPVGVDAFEAHGLCLRAARRSGGVVLPPSYVASGCLDLPFTLDFEPALVEAWARATLGQLVRGGFEVLVLMTGHGPLDLNHLLKRVCAEVEAAEGVRAYGLCWLELNAAMASGPQTGEPTIVDHAALVETSWMLHLEPDLVRTDLLADDPEAAHEGVYGRNPRFSASGERGAAQVAAAAALLAERVGALARGDALDPLADLRRFVEASWPEPLELRGRAGDEAALLVHNPGRASRYVSSLDVEIDGRPLGPAGVTLVNTSPGETGRPLAAADLGPERGFYVRRGQTATVRLGVPLAAGARAVRTRIGLGGVAEATLAADVEFR